MRRSSASNGPAGRSAARPMSAIESTVAAQKDEATGLFRNPNRYQLISAGLDGEFGTADDLGNWTEKPK